MSDNMIISLKEPETTAAVPAPQPEKTPAPMPILPPKPRYRFPMQQFLKGSSVAVLGIVCSAGAYAYFHAPSAPAGESAAAISATTASAASSSVAEDPAHIIAAVGKLILLPQDEVPTIARVTDPSRLVSQPFFANAKVGDMVLMYVQSRKAILYDPEQNKILEEASLDISASSSQP